MHVNIRVLNEMSSVVHVSSFDMLFSKIIRSDCQEISKTIKELSNQLIQKINLTFQLLCQIRQFYFLFSS